VIIMVRRLKANGNSSTAHQVRSLIWMAVVFTVSFSTINIFLLVLEFVELSANKVTATLILNGLVVVWDLPLILSMLYLNRQRMNEIISGHQAINTNIQSVLNMDYNSSFFDETRETGSTFDKTNSNSGSMFNSSRYAEE
jgi:hypothetical protein